MKLIWVCIFSVFWFQDPTRYKSNDDSKNSMILALITCGEGWHNNHHYYQATANQGWFWWEIDISYYVLKSLSWLGIVWDLRAPPAHIKARTIAAESARLEKASAEGKAQAA